MVLHQQPEYGGGHPGRAVMGFKVASNARKKDDECPANNQSVTKPQMHHKLPSIVLDKTLQTTKQQSVAAWRWWWQQHPPTRHSPRSSAAGWATHGLLQCLLLPETACPAGWHSAPCARPLRAPSPTTPVAGCACCHRHSPCRISGTALALLLHCCRRPVLRPLVLHALVSTPRSSGSPGSCGGTCRAGRSSDRARRHRSLARPTCCITAAAMAAM